MGRTLVVYKNRSHFAHLKDQHLLLVDEETGQAYSDDPAMEDALYDKDEVLSIGIGNIARLCHLRHYAFRVAGLDENGAVGKVLDWTATIPMDKFPALEADLARMQSSLEGIDDEDARGFVADIREAIACARREGNPIAFC